MYLKCHKRIKDGKAHRYWSVAEHVTGSGGNRFEKHVLSLGEISDAQQSSWARRIAVFDEGSHAGRQMSLFPSDRAAEASLVTEGVGKDPGIAPDRTQN
jgi:hypothetical protein